MSLNPATINPGDLVSYEDRANPRTTYVVTAVTDNPWSTFAVRNADTGECTFTDGRQHGWKVGA